ncbi:MAG: hypothetical protein ACTHM1_08405 [Solirubrobacteraceae bacterium]
MSRLAEPFLERESVRELVQARWRLHSLPYPSVGRSWSIEGPLRTIRSPGEYATDGRGEHTVRANIRTLWEIDRPDSTTVSVRDNVSTSVSITTEHSEIARFTMDIAAIGSAPGCGLHAQIKHSTDWFPPGLDVPRLPVFIPTLGAVLEFVLGELFQRRWSSHVAGHVASHNWRALQLQAWRRWLEWQREIIEGASVSPWLDIKARLCAALDEC